MVWQQGGGGGVDPAEVKKRAAQQAAAALGDAFQMPDFSYDAGGSSDVDYMAMARQMFAPQTQYLDAQAEAARKRGAENDRFVGGMYGQTVKDILGMAGGIKQNFAQGRKDAGAAYNQAVGSVNQQYDKSRAEQLAILKRLGIEQAAPEVLEQNMGDQAFIASVMAANNQGTQNMLTQMGTAAGTFNTEQGNITRQAGAEARTNMRRSLEDTLAKIAGTRADLEGQINQYGIKMQGDASDNAYARFKDERDFNYMVGKDKAEMDLKRMSMAGQDEGATDPLGKVYSLANQVYGNPQSASNAVRLVSEALGESNPTTAAQFIQAVMQRAHRANGQVNDEANLQRLAALMFNEMYGKQSPRPY